MSKSERIIFAVGFGGFILWQCYIAYLSVRQMEQMKSLYAGFGASLPGITETWLATAPWFFVVPFVSAILSFLCLRRRDLGYSFCITLFAGVALLTILLQAFVFEAIFAPINRMASPI